MPTSLHAHITLEAAETQTADFRRGKEEEGGNFKENPLERMMKEAKPMLQNPSSSTPTTTSHKIQLLPSSPLKRDAIATLQQKSRKTQVAVSDDRLQGGKEEEEEEEKAMSSSSLQCQMEDSGRERLKRHRVEVAGQVWIPDLWGQENFLQDWIDCSGFDSALAPNEIMSARASLVEEGRRANSGRIGVENSC